MSKTVPFTASVSSVWGGFVLLPDERFPLRVVAGDLFPDALLLEVGFGDVFRDELLLPLLLFESPFGFGFPISLSELKELLMQDFRTLRICSRSSRGL